MPLYPVPQPPPIQQGPQSIFVYQTTLARIAWAEFEYIASATSDVAYDARLTGQATDEIAYAARLTGQATDSVTYDARLTGQATDSQAWDARLTGQATSDQAWEARVTGSLGSNQAWDARATGQATDSRTNDARVTAYSTYSQYVLEDTPVGYWQLDEQSGTSAVDLAGNFNTGTFQNTSGVALATQRQASLVDRSRVESIGQQVLPNTGFEANTTGWQVLGTGATLTRDTGVFYSGSASCRVDVTAGSQYNTGIISVLASQRISVRQGDRVRCEFFIKGTNAETFVGYLTESDDAGAYQGQNAGTGVQTLNGDWQRFVIDYNVIASTTRAVQFSVRTGNVSGVQTFYVDQVRVFTYRSWSPLFSAANTDYVNISDSTSLSPTSAMSIEAWVKPTALATSAFDYRTIAIKGSSYWLRVDAGASPSTQNFRFFAYDGAYHGITGSTNVEVGKIYHVVGTYDGTDFKLYVNGVSDATPVNYASTITDQNTALTISATGTTNGWNGYLDEVAIYSYALTSTQVRTHYDVGIARIAEIDARITGYLTNSQAYDARLTGQATDSRANEARATGYLTDSVAFDARLTGQATSSYTQNARITGDIKQARVSWAELETSRVYQSWSARISGALLDSVAYDARITGQATSNQAWDARLTGQATDSQAWEARLTAVATGADVSVEYSARLTGQATDSYSQDARVTGQASSSLAQDARLTGQATASQAWDSRITGQAASSQAWDARATGVATTNQAWDAFVTGQLTSNITYDARVTGAQPSLRVQDAAISGLGVDSRTNDARLTSQDSANVTYDARISGTASDNLAQEARLQGYAPITVTYDARMFGVAGSFAEYGAFINGYEVQHIYPVSDTIAVGPPGPLTTSGWTAVPSGDLYTAIDEGSPDDSDYIISSSGPTTPDICEVALSPATDPQTDFNHIIRTRVAVYDVTALPISLTVRLMQGTTEIAHWTYPTMPVNYPDAYGYGIYGSGPYSEDPPVYYDFEEELTPEQAAAITDYSDLRLRFEALQ